MQRQTNFDILRAVEHELWINVLLQAVLVLPARVTVTTAHSFNNQLGHGSRQTRKPPARFYGFAIALSSMPAGFGED